MSHVQVIRGTFDLSDLDRATSAAAAIAEELRGRFPGDFVRMETLKSAEGQFLWLAYFEDPEAVKLSDEVHKLLQHFQDQVKNANVSFTIEDSRPYEVTYSGPSAPSGPAD